MRRLTGIEQIENGDIFLVDNVYVGVIIANNKRIQCLRDWSLVWKTKFMHGGYTNTWDFYGKKVYLLEEGDELYDKAIAQIALITLIERNSA